VLATEPFRKLLEVMLRARQAPQTAAIVMRRNPENLDPPALAALADKVLDEAVLRLTSGRASRADPIE